MKRLVMTFLAGMLLGGLAAPGQVPDASEVLDRLEAAMGNFTDLTARLSIVHFREGLPDLTQEVQLYLLQPDKLRLEYLAPDYLAGNVALAVGDRLWVYIAAADTWYEKDLSDFSPSQQPWITFRALLKSVRGEYWGYELHVQKDGDLLLLSGVPHEEEAAYGRIELWVDPATWLPVRRKLYDVDGNYLGEACFLKHTEVAPGLWLPLEVEIYDEEGSPVSGISYLEIEVDVGVPETLFVPPEGSGGSGG